MDIRLILMLLLTSSSQAIISPSTINADAAAITALNEVLKSSSPAVFHRGQSLVCEMINKCCSFIKPHLANYIGDPITGSSDLVTACIGHHPRQSLLDKCPTLTKFTEIHHDENFFKFITAIRTAMNEMQSADVNIPLTCSSDEAYAVLCNGTNRQQIESCERKRLIYVTEHRSDDEYLAFVLEIKKNLLLFINAVKEAFPTMNITITTTSEQITSVLLDSAQRTMCTLLPLFNLLLVVFFYWI
jgi:hypothetical protein